MFKVGDEVHFASVDLDAKDLEVNVFTHTGKIVAVEKWGGYVCKPHIGTERFVASDLVHATHADLKKAIVTRVTFIKEHVARSCNAAIKQYK